MGIEDRLNILIVAYSCRPQTGSEFAVGWNTVKHLSRYHNLWVITSPEVKEPIEEALKVEPLTGVTWIYFDIPACPFFWNNKGKGVNLHYYLWEAAVYFFARRLSKKVSFRATHQITLVRYWMPGFLAFLNIPFIWGPTGGADDAPFSFVKEFTLRGKIFELFRVLIRFCAEFDPFLRMAAKRTHCAFANNIRTFQRLEAIGCRNVELLAAEALTREELDHFSGMRKSAHQKPLHFISVSRLVFWKGLHLSIKAFAKFNREFPESRYLIIGSGPDEPYFKCLVKRYGVERSVTFAGHIERDEVLEKMSKSFVLLHPSLHDSGGWVCVEAMALGLPVIYLDIGGPPFLIGDKAGVKIKPINPLQCVQDIFESMKLLTCDSSFYYRLSEAGIKRAENTFLWESKAAYFASLYNKCIRDIVRN